MANPIPFIGFAPDINQTTPGVITDAQAISPSMRGYYGGAGLADAGMTALADTVLSASALVQLNGTIRTIIGSPTKLYEKTATTWTNVSRATPAYAASASNPWRLAQFGNTALAVNKNDQLQSSASGAFANLNAPTAGVMCTWKGFVVLADTNNGGSGTTYGDSPARWWTSAYLDVTSWTPSIATQSTTGELVETPGKITGLKVLGEYVIAYKAESIYVGRDAGSPSVLGFSLVPGEIGCASHDAIVSIGMEHIFIGKNDIYIFDGNSVKAIGEAIRLWFFADLDATYVGRIQSVHNEQYGFVTFSYPRLGSAGVLTGGITYNYRVGKWGVDHRFMSAPFEYYSGGYTYATLPIEGLTYADWPAISYDDSFWDANKVLIAFVAADGKVYTIININSANASPSYITSGSYGDENTYTYLDRVTLRYLLKPVVAPTMTHYYSDDLGSTWTTGQTITETNGRFDVMWIAPWHKVKFNFTGFFEVTGASVDAQSAGDR